MSSNFYDGKYNSAEDKQKISNDFVFFVGSGFAKDKFTDRLYKHLMGHCGFIAHYNIHGFYDERFEDIDGRLSTFEQLSSMNGPYLRDENTSGNGDLNKRIKELATKLLPVVIRERDRRMLDHLEAQKSKTDMQIKSLQDRLST